MIKSGQVTVASAGTAVQAGTDTAQRLYFFCADPGNTGNIYIGNDGSDDVSSTTGLVLSNLSPMFAMECALSELYVDAATNGDKLTWLLVL